MRVASQTTGMASTAKAYQSMRLRLRAKRQFTGRPISAWVRYNCPANASPMTVQMTRYKAHGRLRRLNRVLGISKRKLRELERNEKPSWPGLLQLVVSGTPAILSQVSETSQ